MFPIKRGVEMKVTSEITGQEYEAEDCLFIPNMLQNFKYLKTGLANSELVDIVCGKDEKLIFVWKKSPLMSQLYDLWCKHEL